MCYNCRTTYIRNGLKFLGDIGITRQPQKAKECIKKAVALGSNEAKDFLEQAEKQHLFS